jgi:CheY-like chemotaxis protein
MAVLSHELRTPLTPVMLTASMLESDEEIPERARRELGTIRRNIELEARLIDDLLDLTRVARAKLRLDLQTTDLHSVIRHAIEICRADAKASIEVQLQAQNHHVRADPARIQQVFWNLLSNAVKFTPAGGRISVKSSDGPEGQIIAQVIDTGAGIEPELLPKLFNAFEQGEAVKERKIGGLGLGLAISKALAHAHGGTLTAHSEGKGRGATFTLELPTVSPAPRQRPAVEQESGKLNRTLRILLVEDHESTLMVMSKLLSRWRHQVTTASTVASAMQAAERQTFDLVISDLGLPDGMGYDVMRSMRERSGTIGIAISGYGMDGDIEKSKAAGFVEHLIKPVDPGALEAAIARAAVSIS